MFCKVTERFYHYVGLSKNGERLLSDEGVQRVILRFLYDIWRKEPFQYGTLDRLIEEGVLQVSKDVLYKNAEYLASKGLIERSQAAGCYLTRITVYGIDAVEDKRLSSDVKIRRRLLEVLEELFNEKPEGYAGKEELVQQTGFSEVEVERNIMYLEGEGYVKVDWFGGGQFIARITALGIDSLKEPTVFEKEVIFMKNAYSLLYRIENELRTFIERELRERYGDEWWEKGVPLNVRENAERNAARDEQAFRFSLIYFTEFGDLKRIIMREENWHGIFKEYFKTLEGIVSRLGELEVIRHRIAHTRLLSNDDYAKLELFYREIKKMIG